MFMAGIGLATQISKRCIFFESDFFELGCRFHSVSPPTEAGGAAETVKEGKKWRENN